MPFEFGADVLHDFDRAIEREWIETNGLGGWASSTIVGANTRRYHGLLVAGSRTRSERWVLVSKIDEMLVIGDERFELGCNRYPGVVSPLGFEWMTSFRRDHRLGRRVQGEQHGRWSRRNDVTRWRPSHPCDR